MGKILVFQHVPYEILGTFDPMIRDRGFRVRYINFGRDPDSVPNVTKYDGLIVLGGPMNVGQADDYPHLKTELEALRIALDNEIPIMGICLGAQLLAKTLGARVSRCPEKEIGWYDVTPTEEGLEDPSLVTSKRHAKSLNGTVTHSRTHLEQCDSQNREHGKIRLTVMVRMPMVFSFILKSTNPWFIAGSVPRAISKN